MNTLTKKQTLIIVDLETTCWAHNEKRDNEMEIIEIGAVKVDLNTREIIDEFNRFIKPSRNSMLSDFCKELTSIKQEDVDAAERFPIVFGLFLDWIGDLNRVIFSSWSNFDRRMFQKDCTYHNVAYPFGENHFDIKIYFARMMGEHKGLSSAMKMLELEFEGVRHRGIDDARNTYRVYRVLETKGNQTALEL
jgi:inhibitor of KinA sporulation pathway (predicted exonuclease)